MYPILFSAKSTSFTTNGIGRLRDIVSCTVTEERNGQYELELKCSVYSDYFRQISISSIIVAKPRRNYDVLQAFRVYKMSRPINMVVTINAYHISYQLSHIPCMPFEVPATTHACDDTLQFLKYYAVEDCPFTFYTNVDTEASYKQTTPASIRQRLGGVEGSVLDQFGGEYEWDNYKVSLWKSRGRTDTGIELRYGKNITDIKHESDIVNTVTGVVPFWADFNEADIVVLPEKAIYSSNAGNFPYKLTVPLDLSEKFEEKPSEASLRSAARSYLNQSYIGTPNVSLDVSFVALWQTEEYKDIAELEEVRLCDEVSVIFNDLGINVTAKVIKTEFDVINEKYNKIQIGNPKSNLTTTLYNQWMG